ncbi:MAG: glycosyltransferase family 4 protein [Acidaminococcaceae bacterium]|nr:glycosyltransferase family 4 protein [Acidaminococcaceae bacterium]
MRVIQLLPTISYGDAVGNDVLAIREILRGLGYETAIYAENIDSRLPEGAALPYSCFPQISRDDVVIYHASTGTDLNYALREMPGRKLMIYHNITPPEFFAPYSQAAMKLCDYGLKGVRNMPGSVEYCISDSEFNKRDLLRMGFTCPIDVCPIIIPFSDYETPPNPGLMEKYGGDGVTNLLFVGRIAPNKKQEDVIRAFYAYHRFYDKNSRLILCGSWNGMERYYQRLADYAEALGLRQDVIFTGHIRFEEILAWYRVADAFVCMSEHEGFCVPLVEAMYFNVPIVAYNSSAIPETLGDSGVLLEDKSPALTAAAIDRVVSNKELREKVISRQQERLNNFSYEVVDTRLKDILARFFRVQQKKKTRIIQLCTTISRGDAVSNDIFAFRDTIVEMGYSAPIYTEIAPVGAGWEDIKNISELKSVDSDDIVLYHHATGTNMAEWFSQLPCKRILVYHNVTPPEFFAPYDQAAEKSCEWGLQNLKAMRHFVNACIAVSAFNKRDLISLGYACPIDVCPIIVPFSDYDKPPDMEILERYNDGRTNIIFVGRCAPNKKFEDVISAYAEYKNLDKSARLIFVGSFDGQGDYYKFLRHHIKKLNVSDVLFTGHIPFSQILAYYRTASVFLCMSEHEGFCVPLIEAMYFHVPVVAYKCAAVPETMGNSGLLLSSKEPGIVAKALFSVMRDSEYRKEIVERQNERMACFTHKATSQKLKDILNTYIKEQI